MGGFEGGPQPISMVDIAHFHSISVILCQRRSTEDHLEKKFHHKKCPLFTFETHLILTVDHEFTCLSVLLSFQFTLCSGGDFCEPTLSDFSELKRSDDPVPTKYLAPI